MSELSLRGVVVRYEERVAVAGVSLDVASGETVAVLGPSGCGKSSLLRAIAGLEPLVAGTVALGGVDLAGVPTHRRGVGLMFQDHALFAHMSVARNVGFGLRMAKWPRAQAADRVEALLAMVGLRDRGSDDVADLSGGEQQRVALARTLAPEPAVVLLDEPLGSLDRVLRRELIQTLATAFDETNATVLYVTHDREEAFALADRVALMRDGSFEQVASSQAKFARSPANTWVTDFLRD